jgi:predicted dehydrogenase
MKNIRVGLVGAGFAARFHLECFKKVYGVGVEVVGISSLSHSRRDKLASEFGLKTFDSLGDLIAKVDVIDVCVPPYSHERVAVHALEGGCDVIIEKPLTGYFGDGSRDFMGDKTEKEIMLKEALSSVDRIHKAQTSSGRKVMYAENWVYAPSIQKELEILRSTRGQILWMIGDESHSGSHSESYGIWSKSGGGSLIGKGCHPLTAALYLKEQEGILRDGKPIRVDSVSANVHEITRSPEFKDEKYLRTSYTDVEDYAQLHITFTDGTVADIFSSELVLGGTHSWLEVFANNHRTKCRISPVEVLSTYNPREKLLEGVYVTEKIGTKQGWNSPTLDEFWFNGYYQEMQDFMESVCFDRRPLCGLELGRECIAALYSGYVSAERQGSRVSIAR